MLFMLINIYNLIYFFRNLSLGGTAVKQEIILPDVINAGIYDASVVYKNVSETRKRMTSVLSCLDIAQKTGFSSQSYFNYTFKKETGITPVKYKKQSESKYPD